MHEHDRLLNRSRQTTAASTSSLQDAGQPTSVDHLLTAAEVCAILGRSRTSLYRDIEKGRIPAPVKLGGSSRWPASEIRALIEKARAARDVEVAA